MVELLESVNVRRRLGCSRVHTLGVMRQTVVGVVGALAILLSVTVAGSLLTAEEYGSVDAVPFDSATSSSSLEANSEYVPRVQEVAFLTRLGDSRMILRSSPSS